MLRGQREYQQRNNRSEAQHVLQGLHSRHRAHMLAGQLPCRRCDTTCDSRARCRAGRDAVTAESDRHHRHRVPSPHLLFRPRPHQRYHQCPSQGVEEHAMGTIRLCIITERVLGTVYSIEFDISSPNVRPKVPGLDVVLEKWVDSVPQALRTLIDARGSQQHPYHARILLLLRHSPAPTMVHRHHPQQLRGRPGQTRARCGQGDVHSRHVVLMALSALLTRQHGPKDGFSRHSLLALCVPLRLQDIPQV